MYNNINNNTDNDNTLNLNNNNNNNAHAHTVHNQLMCVYKLLLHKSDSDIHSG